MSDIDKPTIPVVTIAGKEYIPAEIAGSMCADLAKVIQKQADDLTKAHARHEGQCRITDQRDHDLFYANERVLVLENQMRELIFRVTDTLFFDLYGKLRREIESARNLLKDDA